MSDNEPFELDAELMEPVAQFVFDSIKLDLFNGLEDHPMPEEEIRAALQQGGGCIKVGKSSRSLLVTHRQGRLLIHRTISLAVIHDATTITDSWEDRGRIDERRVLLGVGETGLLVELPKNSPIHVNEVCPIHQPNRPPAWSNSTCVTVTVLDMKSIGIDTFIKGLEAAQPAAVPA